MKCLNLDRRALSVFVAAMFLAGCGGSQGLIGQPVTPKQAGYNLANTGLAGSEVLTASHVRIHATCSGGSQFFGGTASYRVQGTATGPFPGTFTADGSWSWAIFLPWHFRESFKITSGTSRISGKISLPDQEPYMTCPPGAEFGPSSSYYKVRGEHRRQVQINVIKRNDFSETLYDFKK